MQLMSQQIIYYVPMLKEKRYVLENIYTHDSYTHTGDAYLAVQTEEDVSNAG